MDEWWTLFGHSVPHFQKVPSLLSDSLVKLLFLCKNNMSFFLTAPTLKNENKLKYHKQPLFMRLTIFFNSHL